MLTAQIGEAALTAQAIVDWWKLAGIEYLVEDNPVHWMAPAPAPTTTDPARPDMIRSAGAQATALVTPHSRQWPITLCELESAIASDRLLPGNGYGAKSALPNGPAKPELMIISDFPEESEISAGKMGELPLLKNMLRAAEIAQPNCYFASLAYTRPTVGALKPQDKAILAAFIHHQIGLVMPQKILLLGSAVAELLLQIDVMQGRGQLLNINHDVGTMAAMATFHPRTLAVQPILKAKCWQDLQMLMRDKDA